jgi:tetratricopeptide (TPR) repeat protein
VEAKTGFRIGLTHAALIFVASAACLCAQSSPRAMAEAESGLALARQDKYEQAIPHYRAAIQLDPHFPGIYLNLGLAYFKLDRFKDAAAVLEKAAKADPKSFQVRVLLGMSYFGSRRFDSAATHLKIATRQQPDNIELRYKLAQCYLWTKQYQAAIDEFHYLLTRDPDSAPVHMLMGEVLDASNREDEATREFEAAVKASPGLPLLEAKALCRGQS